MIEFKEAHCAQEAGGKKIMSAQPPQSDDSKRNLHSSLTKLDSLTKFFKPRFERLLCNIQTEFASASIKVPEFYRAPSPATSEDGDSCGYSRLMEDE